MTHQAAKMTSSLLSASEQEKQRKIARIAYGYWLARAFQGGSPAEDWLRADREVRGKAGVAKLKQTAVGSYLVS
jgi:hypothetical protein